MSVFDILEKLNAIDFSKLSLDERRQGEQEIQLQLEKIATLGSNDHSSFTKKIALLKIWQKFNQLNIRYNQNSFPAADKNLKAIPGTIVISELSLHPDNEVIEEEESVLEVDKTEETATILIKEDVEVDGLAFEHGSVVEVPFQSADKLIATEKTEKVEDTN